ncbi:hypothetical protein [Roseomonas populi]|uniref:Lipoprotein n=1 Tax=Roseomonas populi TaxID=3121582 RepID=A0ABT1X3H8_9PROT|nr:hypothetical protein [Roseomonas pecuniae]MCR0982254.1 hypothetical protein [Roseomonas pecuniae]
MSLRLVVLLGPLLLGACAVQQERQFQASDKSSVEMRAMQSRIIDGDAPTVTRGVVATLQDLGYRINKAEPAAGSITATKLERLRLTAVVRPVDSNRAAVRANAVVVLPQTENQVDDPQFYQQNFFAPLSTTLGREAFAAPADTQVPDAAVPRVTSDLPGGGPAPGGQGRQETARR